MSNLSGATTAVFVVKLSAALEVAVSVDWQTKDGTAKAGADYEAASGTVTFEAGETEKQIQVIAYGREAGDTESKTFSILLYPPENAILDQTLTEVEIQVIDDGGIAVTSLVVAAGPRGLKGDPGLSAYELAKMQGFEGNLQDWLEVQNPSAEMLRKADEAAESAAEAKLARDQTQQIIDDAGEQSTLVVLAQPQGAGKSGMLQGGTVQDALKSCVSVFAHGAKGDFNPTTKTGTDDTQAFKDAISYAISHGLRNVYVPAGHYLITDELNIGGQSFISGEGNRDYWRGVVDGVHIFGDGPYSTILVFDPPTPNAPCLSARGGWGTHSPRAISQLAIEPLDWVDYSSTAEGTGILLQGCCFVPVTDVNIGRFHRGVHLWNKLQGPSDTGNTFASGDFTEFNRMTRVRIFNCDINADYQVTKGNNSFHGNSWRDCMFQINPYGGIGLRMWDDGTRAGIVAPTDPRYQYIANVYNNNFDINFFGSDSQTCYLMSLIRAQGRGCSGTMTVEAAVTLKTDTYEWFQSFGSLHSISAVNTSVGATDKATRPVAFMWNNLALPENYFDGADSILLSTSYPRQFDLNNYQNTGMDLLNVRGGQSGNIWSQQYSPVSVGWLFTVRDQSVSRPGQRVRWQFSYDGTKIKAPAQPSVGLYNSTVGIDITATAAVPSVTATIDLGSSLLRYNRCYFDGWDISRFGVVPTADASFSAGSSSLRINRSYVVSRYYTATVFDSAGAGSPEGVVAAGIGSTYRRTDGGSATTFYVKESGTGNTGWVAK